uniref:Uncharacterized protein n=1 Tax=Glossina brevipalpis TaxID=37001 RepID=A0A1A9WV09_9MUSC
MEKQDDRTNFKYFKSLLVSPHAIKLRLFFGENRNIKTGPKSNQDCRCWTNIDQSRDAIILTIEALNSSTSNEAFNVLLILLTIHNMAMATAVLTYMDYATA